MGLFLLDQTLAQLSDATPLADRKRIICGGEPDDEAAPASKIGYEPWTALARDDMVKTALSREPWKRVALVCDAGNGKTTTMEYMQRELSARGSRQLALLLRLDTRNDLEEMLAKKKKAKGNCSPRSSKR